MTTVVKKEPFWKNKYIAIILKYIKLCFVGIRDGYRYMIQLLSSISGSSNKIHPQDKYTFDEETDDVIAASPGTSGKGLVTKGKGTSSSKGNSTTSSKNNEKSNNQDDIELGGEETDELLEVDINTLSFDEAMWGGYLNTAEYTLLAAWYGGLFMIMMFGVTISLSTSPRYIGEVIWVALITFILSIVPIIKYFNTYIIDTTMKNMIKFVILLHFLFCIIFFILY